MERTNSGVFLLVIFAFLAVYLFPLYDGGRSSNELTDWAMTAALVENNSLDLAPIRRNTGIELDTVVINKDGSVYATRAPGIALISAPFYAITRTVIGEPHKNNVRTSWAVLRLVTGAIPLLILGFWLYNREVDSYSLAVLLFATPLFPYSLLYYPHVLVAILVYMAFRLIYDSRRVRPETCFSAAFLLGVAIVCDYAAIVPAIVFGFGLLMTERFERIRRLIFYTAGILPPIGLLLVYNFIVFGFPFEFLSYTGFSLPTLNALYLYLASPSHGLLVFSPIFLLALLALPTSDDTGGRVRLVVKIAAVIITFLAVIGGGEKFGGDSVGPRHLIIIMPLLLDSCFDGEIEEYPSVLRGIVFTVSFLFCTLPLLTFPFASATLEFPHNSFWVPLLTNEAYGFTIANTFGYAVSHWTILPAALLLLAALFFVWRDAKFRVPFAIGMFLGVGIAAAYFFAVSLEPEAGSKFVEEAGKILGGV